MRTTVHEATNRIFARRTTSLLWFGAVAAAAGIISALAASAAPGYLPFTPPAGWQFVKNNAGVLIWRVPGNASFRQNIVVARAATRLTAQAYDSQQLKALQNGVPGFKLGSFSDAVVCYGGPGHYFSYGGVSNGRPFVVEHMTMIHGDFAWSAQYTRLASQPSIAAARKALTTLCGSDLSPSVSTRATAVPTGYAAGAPPSPPPDYGPTQPPAGGVAATVTPRVGP